MKKGQNPILKGGGTIRMHLSVMIFTYSIEFIVSNLIVLLF